ncbi:hypothetical protein UFOVP655_96 [uncultured Caudovirales phage]|uniref:Uncharacterized protein n=1 Tax=uncultured Caudovirales phage TaxID=2100421 RepID=A0A6J5NC18_9CAUD|nr:hypothetical protein UFOVP655_96 [uncultured Caudovirales phage]
MGISHERVSIGTTATLISAMSVGRDGQTVAIQNPTGSTVYLGGAGVTTSSYGYELGAGITFSIEMSHNEQLYGVVATGTQTVNVIRQGA